MLFFSSSITFYLFLFEQYKHGQSGVLAVVVSSSGHLHLKLAYPSCQQEASINPGRN